jgi:dethiobiotin synthetase
MNPRGYFIAGTDTGIGKTVVSAALLVALRRRGLDAIPVKPVQTGSAAVKGRLLSMDLQFSMSMAEMTVQGDEHDLMSPYNFTAACSPHLAASMTGESISIHRISSGIAKLCSAHDMVVVEGSGGILVPISDKDSFMDLILELGMPVVLVARPSLGTLNHTFLSLSMLSREGVRVAGVVLNHSANQADTFIERDNVATIEKLGKVPVHVFPFVPDIYNIGPATFAAVASTHLDRLVSSLVQE